jgi:hypothetical protein
VANITGGDHEVRYRDPHRYRRHDVPGPVRNLHWTDTDGVTLRGRTNVLRWLFSQQVRLAAPARFELRDGQIYRWWSA